MSDELARVFNDESLAGARWVGKLRCPADHRMIGAEVVVNGQRCLYIVGGQTQHTGAHMDRSRTMVNDALSGAGEIVGETVGGYLGGHIGEHAAEYRRSRESGRGTIQPALIGLEDLIAVGGDIAVGPYPAPCAQCHREIYLQIRGGTVSIVD